MCAREGVRPTSREFVVAAVAAAGRTSRASVGLVTSARDTTPGPGPDASRDATSDPPRNGPTAIPRPGVRPRRRDTDVATIARKAVRHLADGRFAELPIAIRFWDGSTLGAGRPAPSAASPAEHPPAVVVAADPRALAHHLHRPSELGLARAWVDGSLTVDGDLEQALATRHALRGVRLSRLDRLRLAAAAVRVGGPGILRRPPPPAVEASISGRRRSLARDRAAVRHHYDLSNDFYEVVLGPSMVYSCAYFADPGESLEQAQTRKLDRICHKLRIAPGERLLDIGCGWGSLVIHAAERHGAHAVGVTLSEPQAELARERARALGLERRVEIRVADYRELTDGPFDKIASVGMYEHVGRSELERYVRTVAGLLRPGGLFLNHGIVRLDSTRPSRPTFITTYVFPDGDLHPVTDLLSSLQPAGLELRDTESLREHYPLTLRRWAANLQAHERKATEIVGAERVRVWQLYMLASAQAFEAGEIAVYQVLAARFDGPHGLPLDRSAPLGPPTG
jgi:cyclopropane-fatty-acyl-phospholipid synthase